MKTKIFGILATAAIVAVIALSLINVGNYRSLLPARPARTAPEAIVADTVADSTAVMQTLPTDTTAVATETEAEPTAPEND